MMKKIVSLFMMLFAAIIWGFAFVAQVEGMKNVSTLTFNAIRFLIGALMMLPSFFIFSKKKVSKEAVKASLVYGIIAGLLLFAAVTAQQYAIEFSPDENSMKAGFITGLYTVTVPIFGFLFLKKKTPPTVWVGAAVALIGLYLLCSVSGESLHITDLLLFLTVPIWSVHILLVDAKSHKIDPFAFSCVQYTVCGTLSLIGAILIERSFMQLEAIGQAIIPILYGGILSVGVAYTLQIIAQKHSDPTVAAIIFSTESVFCCIGNLIFFKVDMTFTQYIGCALIFAGIVISQLVLKNKKAKTDP